MERAEALFLCERRRSRRILDVRAADLQEEMAEQRFSVPPDPTKTAATQRTSQRAERAIEHSAIARAAPNKWHASAVSETSPPEPDEPVLERLRRQDTRLDDYIDRYAARAHGMTASAIRALFAVANRPEVVSLAGGMPNITDLPLDVVGSASTIWCSHDGRRAMQYGSGQGEPAIREAICEVMRAGEHLGPP